MDPLEDGEQLICECCQCHPNPRADRRAMSLVLLYCETHGHSWFREFIEAKDGSRRLAHPLQAAGSRTV